MAFKLRSGNTTNFKSMGSSPAKQGVDDRTIEQRREDRKPKRGEDPYPDHGKGLVVPKKNKYGITEPEEPKRGEDPYPHHGQGYNPTPKKYGSKKSPAKQRVDPLDLGLLDEAKKVKVNKGLPKNFNTSGKDSWVKKSKEILKKGSTKGSTTTRFLGNKTLGLMGLLMANDAYAKTDQPKFPKGSKHYQDPKKKIDFTKTK
jgi:hypothetical protein